MDVLSSTYAHILQNRMRRPSQVPRCPHVLGNTYTPAYEAGNALRYAKSSWCKAPPIHLFNIWCSLLNCTKLPPMQRLYSVNTKLPPLQCLSSEQSSPKLRFAYKPLTASTLDFLVALPSCTEALVQKRNSCHIWGHNVEKHNFCCSFIANYTVVKV